MTGALPHITVAICTFKRSALLPELLGSLERQDTGGLFTHDVVIVDNDAIRSAEQTVTQYAKSARVRIAYDVEPEENIALARNRAVMNAAGDFVAFIDDDEVPDAGWLQALFRTRLAYQAEGVLGPVLARFQSNAPTWVAKGRFFDRPRYATGRPVQWREARTGNVLFSRDVLRHVNPPFRRQFGSGGEDVDFFRRLHDAGCTFVWCDEAIVHEWVPAFRCTRRFLIRRALLRGSNFPKQSAPRTGNVLKSVVAVPSYALALPVLAVLGHHLFVAYLAKLCEHGSRLLALAGMPVMTQRDT